LIELLAVIAITAILSAVLLPALSKAKERTAKTQCLSNIHQLEVATSIYAADSKDKLPVLTGGSGWAWDLPDAAADIMLASGLVKKSFYCPGTQPRFTDWENFQEPGDFPMALSGICPLPSDFISLDKRWRFQARPVF